MIDRDARDRLAELLRRLAGGLINTDHFASDGELIAEVSADEGVRHAYGAVASLRPDYLPAVRYVRGRRLPADLSRVVEIGGLFLDSNTEYEWPATNGPGGVALDAVLCICCGAAFTASWCLPIPAVALRSPALLAAAVFSASLGIFLFKLSRRLAAQYRQRWEEEQNRHGDFDVWPFLRRGDFEAARHRHGSPVAG